MKNANESEKNTCKSEITTMLQKFVYEKTIKTSDSTLELNK